MCCFSRAVLSVSQTQIFARPLEDGRRQALVYSMTLAFDEELAMILPLPVDTPEDSGVEFVDLSSYRSFFGDLEKCFPPPKPPPGVLAPAVRQALSAPRLTVHDVGDYVASFVPTARDFTRLDPRFRLPTSIADLHPAYVDWGFAVFQLKPRNTKSKQQTVQPMALTFPSRKPGAIFFPTLHIHDGASIEALARFDHALFLQTTDALLAAALGWRRSDDHVGKHVKTSKMGGIAAPDHDAHRAQRHGTYPNEDTWIEPPVCSGIEKLAGKGDRFAFTIDASAAYRPALDAKERQRRAAVQTGIDALHAGLLAGLSQLTSANAAAWDLITPKPPTFWDRLRGSDIPQLWLSNRRAFLYGPRGLEVLPPGSAGPYQIEISAETDRIPRQAVRFLFAHIPSEAVIEEIERALAGLLDRCL